MLNGALMLYEITYCSVAIFESSTVHSSKVGSCIEVRKFVTKAPPIIIDSKMVDPRS